MGRAASQLLSEAVGERQQETHGEDPGAEPLSLLRLVLLLLLQEQLLQESSTCTASDENRANVTCPSENLGTTSTSGIVKWIQVTKTIC